MTPTSREIIEAVAAKHDLSSDAILGPARWRKVAHARQEAFFEIKRQRKLTLGQIGLIFGRDHTTVLYGIRAHRDRMAWLEGRNT